MTNLYNIFLYFPYDNLMIVFCTANTFALSHHGIYAMKKKTSRNKAGNIVYSF